MLATPIKYSSAFPKPSSKYAQKVRDELAFVISTGQDFIEIGHKAEGSSDLRSNPRHKISPN